jgi:DNA-directed RNA polymerase subunit RPC12/RpoP
MEQRIYHGSLSPRIIADALVGEFNRGNLRVQQFGSEKEIVVQISTHHWTRSGGDTALTVNLREVEDGVSVDLGKQAWFGVAASLGKTALSVWKNPFQILERLDDLAQDFESMQMTDKVWEVLEDTTRSVGATFELSERLRRMVCTYCLTANAVGAASCLACGAPLGLVQPKTCTNCGFIVKTGEMTCPNCGQPIPKS